MVEGEANGVSSIERGGVKVLFLLIHTLNKLLENTASRRKEYIYGNFLFLAMANIAENVSLVDNSAQVANLEHLSFFSTSHPACSSSNSEDITMATARPARRKVNDSHIIIGAVHIKILLLVLASLRTLLGSNHLCKTLQQEEK